MNISKGLYHTIYHPRLIIIPLIVNVILTFITGVATYFGFTMFPFPSIITQLGIHTSFPYGLPLLNDIFHFSQEPSTTNWLFSIIATVFILLIKSYALGMYLGSMKCFLEGPYNTISILKIAAYYFKRMIRYSIIELTICGLIFLISLIIWQLSVIAILILLFFSLTPYIIVLEDTTIRDAIAKSPKLFKKNFGTIFFIVLTSMIITFLLTMLPITDKKMQYYIISLLYSFIGTVMIFAVMSCLHYSIHNISLPLKSIKKSRRLFPLLWISALLLPLLGAWLAAL